MCDNLDSLDEPEARASMIWIIGEYAERIDNADELLQSFLDGFQVGSLFASLFFLGCRGSHGHEAVESLKLYSATKPSW